VDCHAGRRTGPLPPGHGSTQRRGRRSCGHRYAISLTQPRVRALTVAALIDPTLGCPILGRVNDAAMASISISPKGGGRKSNGE
jgi:hypothetical protein